MKYCIAGITFVHDILPHGALCYYLSRDCDAKLMKQVLDIFIWDRITCQHQAPTVSNI